MLRARSRFASDLRTATAFHAWTGRRKFARESAARWSAVPVERRTARYFVGFVGVEEGLFAGLPPE